MILNIGQNVNQTACSWWLVAGVAVTCFLWVCAGCSDTEPDKPTEPAKPAAPKEIAKSDSPPEPAESAAPAKPAAPRETTKSDSPPESAKPVALAKPAAPAKPATPKETAKPDKPKAPAAAGERLFFEENFEKDLSAWQSEGPNLTEVTGGRLHVKTVLPVAAKTGQFVWLKKDLPADFRVEYDFTPVSESGFFLIFFCTKGVGGEDILEPKLFKHYTARKDFRKYTRGPINSYHISYRRGTTANCNLRKNPGKHMLKQDKLDGIIAANKAAHVVLIKRGGRIRLTVDGKVFMDYTDKGQINSKIYGGGKVCLRQMFESDGYYDNFKVYDLTVAQTHP